MVYLPTLTKKHQPNVAKYTIHGSYGLFLPGKIQGDPTCFRNGDGAQARLGPICGSGYLVSTRNATEKFPQEIAPVF